MASTRPGRESQTALHGRRPALKLFCKSISFSRGIDKIKTRIVISIYQSDGPTPLLQLTWEMWWNASRRMPLVAYSKQRLYFNYDSRLMLLNLMTLYKTPRKTLPDKPRLESVTIGPLKMRHTTVVVLRSSYIPTPLDSCKGTCGCRKYHTRLARRTSHHADTRLVTTLANIQQAPLPMVCTKR